MESIYGDSLSELEELRARLMGRIEEVRKSYRDATGEDPVEHCLSRIKSEESMREKCRRQGIPETKESALSVIHDAIGIRVVCAFLDDVFMIRDALKEIPGCEVFNEKDYINNPKPNGYRSYHMILFCDGKYYAEFQLRTISMDTWAALEHQLKYKKNLKCNISLVTSELKRCADELASTDLSMQTIRDMINDGANG